MRAGISQWQAKKEMLGSITKPNILDIGAFLGEVTHKYRKMFPDSTVHAFEPQSSAFAKLEARFKDDKQVVPVRLAVTAKDGDTQILHIGGSHGEMSSLRPRPPEEGEGAVRRYYRHPLIEEEEVHTITVDTYCRESGIGRVHLLKADIHGAELEMLKGSTEMLLRHRILLIYAETFYVEMYEGCPMFWQICQFLDSFGYTLFDMYDIIRSFVNRQIKMCDALWVSPEVRERILNKYPEEWLLKSLPDAMGGESPVI